MRVFNVEWKWNVPNALSLLRIALVPCFMVLYLLHADAWAFAVLVLSGLSDAFDGYIARKFDQVTDCGKLLDPLSDKLTQVGVVICLTTRYPEILPLTVIVFVKEVCQAIGGMILLHRRCAVRGAKWFGKVSTIVFYMCMLVIVLWHDSMSEWLMLTLLGVACLAMLVAFIGYLRLYLQIRRPADAEAEASFPPQADKPTEL